MLAEHFRRYLERCRIKVELSGPGPEAGSGCVVCYNETSFADVAAFGMIMWPHIDRAVAAELYGYLPFGRRAARKAEIELVPRGNRAATEQLMKAVVDKVKGGERLAWGGEGRISGFDGVARFKVGASLIAIRAQVPIVPITYYGGHQVLPLGSLRARPGTICARFGAPISTKGLREDDARDLADRVQAVVAETFAALKADAGRR